jgi:hypothetical protein
MRKNERTDGRTDRQIVSFRNSENAPEIKNIKKEMKMQPVQKEADKHRRHWLRHLHRMEECETRF